MAISLLTVMILIIRFSITKFYQVSISWIVFFVAISSVRCLHESKHELARYYLLFYAGSVASP
jgi:SNF family Na+-dependent transporter